MRSGGAAKLIVGCCVLWLVPMRALGLDSAQLAQLLRVRAGATCLSAEDLAPLVEQWVYDEPLPRDLLVEVEGSASDPHSANFRVVSAGRTIAHRAFDPGPPRCEHLQAAISLAIALALKVSLLDGLGEALPDDPGAAAWSLTAAGLASHRVLPEFAPGFELRAQYEFGPLWALRLSAFGLLAQTIALERTAVSFDAALLAGRIDVCVRGALTSALYARVCAGLAGGALYAQGHGSASTRSATLAWFAFANAVALGVSISEHWSLELEFSLTVPLRRLRVRVDDSRGRELDGRSLAALGFILGIGPSYRF